MKEEIRDDFLLPVFAKALLSIGVKLGHSAILGGRRVSNYTLIFRYLLKTVVA